MVGEINFACGRCPWCQRGLGRHCPDRRVLGIAGADGAFAEVLALPEQNLHEVPDTLSDEVAVFTEPVAAACEVLEQLGDARPASALVLGDGKLGPLVAQVLAGEGVDVELVGRHVDGLSWLTARGVRVGARPRRARYELVVEATGRAEGLPEAIARTLPRGTLVLKSTVAGEHRINLAPVVVDEITVIGSRCGRFPPALERLERGRVEVRPLVAARYPLAQACEAIRRAGQPGVRKVLITRE